MIKPNNYLKFTYSTSQSKLDSNYSSPNVSFSRNLHLNSNPLYTTRAIINSIGKFLLTFIFGRSL